MTWYKLRTRESAVRCYCTCVSARMNEERKKISQGEKHARTTEANAWTPLCSSGPLSPVWLHFFFFIFVALKSLPSVRVHKLFHSFERPPYSHLTTRYNSVANRLVIPSLIVFPYRWFMSQLDALFWVKIPLSSQSTAVRKNCAWFSH